MAAARANAATVVRRASPAAVSIAGALLSAGLLAVVLVAGVAGCRPSGGNGSAGGAAGSSSAQPTDQPGPPGAPPPLVLSDPRASVMTYIAWVNRAYRLADSQVATAAMDPYEHVRVDSYIQLNREKGRAIEQELLGFELTGLGTRDGTATLAARERWRYRYFALDTLKYQGPEHLARYDATYTVTLDPAKRLWFVSRVEARPLDPLK